MNFSDFFIKGLRNTLKLRNGANFSFKGQEIRVPNSTIVDQWMAGEFSTAAYEIVIERGVDHVEHVNLLVTARVNEVSVMSYGRLNLGKDLVKFTATSDNSKITLVATPYFETDGVTVLSDIKLTFKATYSERLNPVGIPTVSGDSTNLGGEVGVIRNWNNANITNGFLEINESGSIVVSALSNIQVVGQPLLAADFIFSKMKFANIDGSITITTNPTTGTLTLNLTSINDLLVTQDFEVNPANGGTLNNTHIGNTVARTGVFSHITATGLVDITDGNQLVTISPTGTGTVIINPATAGNINNVIIGAVTPRPASISNLTVNGHVLFTGNQSITISPIGLGTVAISPSVVGSINNMSIGASTPAAGKFTSIELLNTFTQGHYLIAMSQLKSILLGASV